MLFFSHIKKILNINGDVWRTRHYICRLCRHIVSQHISLIQGSRMRAMCLFAIAIVTPVLLAAAPNGNGQAAAPANPQLPTGESPKPLPALDQFDGIVIDQTITRAGKDFYQLFSTNWHDQPLSDRYTISVKEQPSARFGSQVYIVFGNRRIFQSQISPNRSQIKAASDAAVEIAYKAVTEGEMQRLLFKDPDIGQDEI